MKNLLNGLLAIGLSSTPAFNLAANKINQLKLSNVHYQSSTVSYNITPNNNTIFKNWLNPTTGGDQSWNSYLHKITENISFDQQIYNISPKAEIGGGVYLNLASAKGHLSQKALPIYKNKDAIGSYKYQTIKNSKKVKFGNPIQPAPDYIPNFDDQYIGNPYGWNSDYQPENSILTQKSGDSNHTNTINFLQGFLTTELNYWYYTTFSSQLSKTVPDYQLNMLNYKTIHDFYAKYFDDLIVLEFGGQYNNVKQEIHYYETTSTLLSIAGLFAAPIPEVGDLLGFLFGALGLILGGGFVTYKSVTNHYRFISQPLSLNVIDKIMSSILGDGSSVFPVQSVINNFIQKNGTYPSRLTLDHFSYGVNNCIAKANESETDEWLPVGERLGQLYWEGYVYRHNATNEINLSNLEPFLNFNINASKAPPDYSSEKNVLDNPSNASKTDPIPIPVGSSKQILPSDWKSDQVITLLNQNWSQMGGLVESLIPYVSYQPVKIIYNQTTLCEMYLPILGFTKDHPRYFYIEGD